MVQITEIAHGAESDGDRQGRTRRFWKWCLAVLAVLLALPWLRVYLVFEQTKGWTIAQSAIVDAAWQGMVVFFLGCLVAVAVSLRPLSETPAETRRLRESVRLMTMAVLTSIAAAVVVFIQLTSQDLVF